MEQPKTLEDIPNLLPCPFCGSKRCLKIAPHNDHSWFIRCRSVFCRNVMGPLEMVDSPVIKWNIRYTSNTKNSQGRLPCPWCGSETEIYNIISVMGNEDQNATVCRNCDKELDEEDSCGSIGPTRKETKVAIQVWNKRRAG